MRKTLLAALRFLFLFARADSFDITRASLRVVVREDKHPDRLFVFNNKQPFMMCKDNSLPNPNKPLNFYHI